MADKNLELRIRLVGDASQLQQAFRNLGQEIQSAFQQASQVARTYEQQVAQLQQHVVNLARQQQEGAKAAQSAAQAIVQLTQAQAAYQKATIAVQAAQAQLAQAQQQAQAIVQQAAAAVQRQIEAEQRLAQVYQQRLAAVHQAEQVLRQVQAQQAARADQELERLQRAVAVEAQLRAQYAQRVQAVQALERAYQQLAQAQQLAERLQAQAQAAGRAGLGGLSQNLAQEAARQAQAVQALTQQIQQSIQAYGTLAQQQSQVAQTAAQLTRQYAATTQAAVAYHRASVQGDQAVAQAQRAVIAQHQAAAQAAARLAQASADLAKARMQEAQAAAQAALVEGRAQAQLAQAVADQQRAQLQITQATQRYEQYAKAVQQATQASMALGQAQQQLQKTQAQAEPAQKLAEGLREAARSAAQAEQAVSRLQSVPASAGLARLHQMAQAAAQGVLLMRQAFQQATQALSAHGQALSNQQTLLQNISAAYARAVGAAGQFIQTARQLAQTVGSQLAQAMNQASQSAHGFGASLGSLRERAGGIKDAITSVVGGIIGAVQSIASFVMNVTQTAVEMRNLQTITGLTARDAGALSLAFQMLGGTAFVVHAALAQLVQRAGENDVSLRNLGVAARDAEGKVRSAKDLLLDLAEAYEKAADKTTFLAEANRLFGGWMAGTMQPLLAMGRKGLEDFIQSAQRLGLVMGEETQQRLLQLRSGMVVLQTIVQRLSQEFLAGLAPALTRITALAVQALPHILNFVQSASRAVGEFIGGFLGGITGKGYAGLVADLRGLVNAFRQTQGAGEGVVQTFGDIQRRAEELRHQIADLDRTTQAQLRGLRTEEHETTRTIRSISRAFDDLIWPLRNAQNHVRMLINELRAARDDALKPLEDRVRETERALTETTRALTRLRDAEREQIDPLREHIEGLNELGRALQLISQLGMTPEIARLLDQLGPVIGSLNENAQQAVQQAIRAGQQIAEERAQLAALQDFIRVLQEQQQELLDLIQETIRALQDEIDAIREAAEEAIAPLQDMLDALSEAQDSFEDMGSAGEGAFNQVGSAADRAAEAADRAAERVARAVERVQELKQQLADVRAQIAEIEAMLASGDFRTPIERAVADLEAARDAELAQHEARIAALRQELDVLSAQNELLREARRLRQQELELMDLLGQTELGRLRQELEALQREDEQRRRQGESRRAYERRMQIIAIQERIRALEREREIERRQAEVEEERQRRALETRRKALEQEIDLEQKAADETRKRWDQIIEQTRKRLELEEKLKNLREREVELLKEIEKALKDLEKARSEQVEAAKKDAEEGRNAARSYQREAARALQQQAKQIQRQINAIRKAAEKQTKNLQNQIKAQQKLARQVEKTWGGAIKGLKKQAEVLERSIENGEKTLQIAQNLLNLAKLTDENQIREIESTFKPQIRSLEERERNLREALDRDRQDLEDARQRWDEQISQQERIATNYQNQIDKLQILRDEQLRPYEVHLDNIRAKVDDITNSWQNQRDKLEEELQTITTRFQPKMAELGKALGEALGDGFKRGFELALFGGEGDDSLIFLHFDTPEGRAVETTVAVSNAAAIGERLGRTLRQAILGPDRGKAWRELGKEIGKGIVTGILEMIVNPAEALAESTIESIPRLKEAIQGGIIGLQKAGPTAAWPGIIIGAFFGSLKDRFFDKKQPQKKPPQKPQPTGKKTSLDHSMGDRPAQAFAVPDFGAEAENIAATLIEEAGSGDYGALGEAIGTLIVGGMGDAVVSGLAEIHDPHTGEGVFKDWIISLADWVRDNADKDKDELTEAWRKRLVTPITDALDSLFGEGGADMSGGVVTRAGVRGTNMSGGIAGATTDSTRRTLVTWWDDVKKFFTDEVDPWEKGGAKENWQKLVDEIVGRQGSGPNMSGGIVTEAGAASGGGQAGMQKGVLPRLRSAIRDWWSAKGGVRDILAAMDPWGAVEEKWLTGKESLYHGVKGVFDALADPEKGIPKWVDTILQGMATAFGRAWPYARPHMQTFAENMRETMVQVAKIVNALAKALLAEEEPIKVDELPKPEIPSGGVGGGVGGGGGQPRAPFATGGYIPATVGGRVIEVGEAGYDEYVLTTDPAHALHTRYLLGEIIRRLPNTALPSSGTGAGMGMGGGEGESLIQPNPNVFDQSTERLGRLPTNEELLERVYHNYRHLGRTLDFMNKVFDAEGGVFEASQKLWDDAARPVLEQAATTIARMGGAVETIRVQASLVESIIGQNRVADWVRTLLLTGATGDSALLPMQGYISQDFGPARGDPAKLGYTFHPGIDIAAPDGTPVYSPAGGIVIGIADTGIDRLKIARQTGKDPGPIGGLGYHLLIQHTPNLYSVFGHLLRGSARFGQGQTVKRGDLIALSDSTGNVTGPHLHWEVREGGQYINPVEAMRRILMPFAQMGDVYGKTTMELLARPDLLALMLTGNNPRAARIIGEIAKTNYGWDAKQVMYAMAIAMLESSGRVGVVNEKSGAKGLFQLMPANRYYEGKTDDELVNEIIGGLRYIAERYGTPERAFRFWQEHHWYDRGGVAGLDGPELALLGERGPELVLDADTTRALARMGVVQLRRGPLELSAPDLAAVGGGTRRSSDAHGGAGTVVHQHLSVSATFLPTQRTRRQEEDMVRALIRDELRRARFGV